MEESSESVVKVFKYRWVNLAIFCLYSGVNFLQFLQYSIISNITAKYYDIDSTLVDLSGLIFMISFILFFLPINYLIEKYNLRITAVISSGLTASGNLIKLLSISRDRYYVVLIGQFLCSVGQVFMLSVPSKLASTWFGAEEVSTACAIAILGTQIGVAAGSIFSSSLVKNTDDMEALGADFMTLNLVNSSMTVAAFGLVLLFFRAKPSVPPSQSQVELVETSFVETVKALVTNRDYLLILLSVGSSNGMCTSFGIIINTVYLHYFPGYESEIGIITALAVIAGGCIGSLIFGIMLDKWHHFKLTTFGVIFVSAVTYIFVVLSMELKSQLATYFTIPLFGFFLTSTLLIGFEFATEVTYPISEAASCSFLTTVIYIFTIVYTLIFNELLNSIGFLPSHAIIVVILVLSSLIIYFVSPRLRRREANLAGQ